VWDIVLLLGDFYKLMPSILDKIDLSTVEDPSPRDSYAHDIQSLRQFLKDNPFPAELVLKLRDLSCQIPELVSAVQAGDSGAQTILGGIKVMIGICEQLSDLLTLFSPSSSTGHGNAISGFGGAALRKMVALAQSLQTLDSTGKQDVTQAQNKLSFLQRLWAWLNGKGSVTSASGGVSLSSNLVAMGPTRSSGGLKPTATSFSAFPTTGAIQRLLPSTSERNVLYAAATNGGLWRTANADAPDVKSIVWTPLADAPEFQSLSFGDLAWDMGPNGWNPNVLVAAYGAWSSYGGRGGDLLGLLRSDFPADE
jgi:hypothetical protein